MRKSGISWDLGTPGTVFFVKSVHVGLSIVMGDPKMLGFFTENLIKISKMHDLGVPPFVETPHMDQ